MPLASAVLQDHQAKLEVPDLLGLLASQDQEVLLDHAARLVVKVLMARWGELVSEDLLVQLELGEKWAPLVHLEIRVDKDSGELTDSLVSVDHLVAKEWTAQLDVRDLLDREDHLELLALLVASDCLAHSDLLVQLVNVDNLELAVQQEYPVAQVLRGHLGQLERVVHRVSLVAREPRVVVV